MLLDQFLYPIALLARDERVLELLGIDARRVLGQQRDHFIGGDHPFQHSLALQKLRPKRQPRLLRLGCTARIIRAARTDQFLRILRHGEPAVDNGIIVRVWKRQGSQKLTGNPPDVGKPVRITIKVPEENIMFRVEINIAAIFGKDQRIQEQLVLRFRLVPEQRTPGTRQGFLLNFTQHAEQILPNFPQDDSLRHLKSRHPLAVFHRFLLTHAFIAFQHHAAAFQHLRELQVHFGAQEF